MSSNEIHPSAIISPKAQLGQNNIIGPYSVIEENVKLGNNNIIKSHVVIAGNTVIGDDNVIYSFSCIGEVPQDKKYNGEESKLIIGSNNTIREYVTINPGTDGGGMLTSVGSHCWIMASVHIAHDCKIGNHVTFANNATLAGHVEVGDYAKLGGLCAIRQFIKIGRYAMIGGMTGVDSDVIPFGIAVSDDRASLIGVNRIGLERAGWNKESIANVVDAYSKVFTTHDNFESRIKAVEQEFANNPEVMEIVNFLLENKNKAICKPKSKLS